MTEDIKAAPEMENGAENDLPNVEDENVPKGEAEEEALEGEVDLSEKEPQETGDAEAQGEDGDAEEKAALLARERDQYKDALIRERADFENYKKRNLSLEATAYERGIEAAAERMLPVLDNFERALRAKSSDPQFEAGMEMIMRQFLDAISSLGIEEIDTSGIFDPNVHHAVMQSEEEGKESGQITETLQKGYLLKGKVIRPAMVKVNK